MKYYYLYIISYIIYAYILWFSLMDIYTKMVSHSSNTTKTAMQTRKSISYHQKNENKKKNTITPFSIEKLKILQTDLNQIVISNFTIYHNYNRLSILHIVG
jgi:hypothetical protein